MFVSRKTQARVSYTHVTPSERIMRTKSSIFFLMSIKEKYKKAKENILGYVPMSRNPTFKYLLRNSDAHLPSGFMGDQGSPMDFPWVPRYLYLHN